MRTLAFFTMSLLSFVQVLVHGQEPEIPIVSVNEIVSNFLDEDTAVTELSKGIVRLDTIISQKVSTQDIPQKPLIFTHAFCNTKSKSVVFVALDDSMCFSESPLLVGSLPDKTQIENCETLPDLEKLLGKPSPCVILGLQNNEFLNWSVSWELLCPTEENTLTYLSISVSLSQLQNADEDPIVKKIVFREVVCSPGDQN